MNDHGPLARPRALAGMILLALLPAAAPAACPDGSCIVYTRDAGDGRDTRTVWRIEAVENAVAEDLSAALQALDPRPAGNDQSITMSPNGEWLALSTDHFDDECAGLGGCLGVVRGDLSGGVAVRANGTLVAPDGIGAIASDGRAVVYPDNEGLAPGHVVDLFIVRRNTPNAAFGAPLNLTANSGFILNSQPAISDDGSRILFNCTDELESQNDWNLCEIGTDGSGFRVVLTPPDLPKTTPNVTILISDYAPDGSIVFENEQHVLRLPAGAPATGSFIIQPKDSNDVSPCVLPGGNVVSLWLSRPGNPSGLHELKVMDSRGRFLFVLNPLQDTFDIGIGCGGPRITCNNRDVTLLGTAGNDRLTGTSGSDVISGGEGNDVLRGLGGRDYLCGGPDTDTLYGGNGNDSLRGDTGRDTLLGEAGKDLLRGNAGDDDLQGGDGDDRLDGGAGIDTCDGGTGSNSVDGCP